MVGGVDGWSWCLVRGVLPPRAAHEPGGQSVLLLNLLSVLFDQAVEYEHLVLELQPVCSGNKPELFLLLHALCTTHIKHRSEGH